VTTAIIIVAWVLIGLFDHWWFMRLLNRIAPNAGVPASTRRLCLALSLVAGPAALPGTLLCYLEDR
jgi:hypothetical protein